MLRAPQRRVRGRRSPTARRYFPGTGAKAFLGRPVIDEQEPPCLCITAARSADGSVENAGLGVLGDGVRPDPPHRPGGVEGFIEVHNPACCHNFLPCSGPAARLLHTTRGEDGGLRRSFRGFACARLQGRCRLEGVASQPGVAAHCCRRPPGSQQKRPISVLPVPRRSCVLAARRGHRYKGP